MKRTIALFLSLALPLSAAITLRNEDSAIVPTVEDDPARPALVAFNRGRHAEAVAAATPLAAKGNPDALYLLGLAAETGRGSDLSLEKALDYYKKAAAAGHMESTYRRALIFLNSRDDDDRQRGKLVLERAAQTDPGVAGRLLGEAWHRGLLGAEPNVDEALTWWTRAAEAGDSTAMILLARLRSGDFGFPEKADPLIALDLYLKAARRNDPRAYLPLGSLLLNGDAKWRNEERGRMWLAKAIDHGQAGAYLALGDHEESIRKDDEAALKHYMKGAEGGQTECMYRAAAALVNGRGVEANESRGIEWLGKASDGGHAIASLELATVLAQREDHDPVIVYTHLLRAANGGVLLAQNELGLFYMNGSLGTSDPAAAVTWFTRAAKDGFAAAQHNLATLYETGVGVPVDYNNAGELFTLAANQGHPESTAALARLYSNGLGNEKDLPRAWAYASLARERGYAKAQEMIDQLDRLLTPEMKAASGKIRQELTESTPAKDEGGGD